MDRSEDNSDGGDVPPSVRSAPVAPVVGPAAGPGEPASITERPVVVAVPLAHLTAQPSEPVRFAMRAPPRPLVPAAYRIVTVAKEQRAPTTSPLPPQQTPDFAHQIADFVDAFAVLSARTPDVTPRASNVSAAQPFAPLPSIAAVAMPALTEHQDDRDLPAIVRKQMARAGAQAAPSQPNAISAPPSPMPGAWPIPKPGTLPSAPPGPLRADPARRPSLPPRAVPVGDAPQIASPGPALARKALKYAGFAVAGYFGLIVMLLLAYRFINPPVSSLMIQQWASGGEVIKEWAPIEDISPQIVRAVLLSEDGRFCQHHGVDLLEMQAAIERAENGGVPRGASTISMQVIKNLFLWPSKSYVRKAIEIPLTYLMEVLWPKRRIMEVYLNIAEWGPGIFGVQSASKFHFNKAASRLNEREAAQLAVALPNPYTRDAGDPGPQTRRLASDVQTRMRNAYLGQTTCVLGARTTASR